MIADRTQRQTKKRQGRRDASVSAKDELDSVRLNDRELKPRTDGESWKSMPTCMHLRT